MSVKHVAWLGLTQFTPERTVSGGMRSNRANTGKYKNKFIIRGVKMKMRKIFKKTSLVALSAVVACGTAVAFAGCTNKDLELKVSIFCNEQDGILNERLCNEWAKSYTETLRADGTLSADEEIEVKFSYETNTDSYFQNLLREISTNTAPDVFYVSPKYVKAWQKLGRVLDLTEYLADDAQNIADVWDDSLGFYGYSNEAGYTSGSRLTWDDSSKTFKTAGGLTAGIYGLPKDYSNFGLGFNGNFFTKAIREDITSKTATTSRAVTGAEYAGASLRYTGAGDEGVITYAAGEHKGEDAPIIVIGEPVKIKPYNFYRYASYEQASQNGDPMALSVEEFTDGEGYTVTIPGFPGDTFADTYTADEYKTMPTDKRNADAVYDSSQGYITYTYAEYGALTWLLTYYFNTFSWDARNTSNRAGNTTSGVGGMVNAIGTQKNVYGNDQYDGVLYLLPWLAGNDANYLNTASTTVKNPTGTTTENVSKIDITGAAVDVAVQYGVNSEKYLDALAAFWAYGSDWNGNSNNAGDTTAAKDSGWDLFCGGSVIFYGAGTWDAATRNRADINFLQFRSMPEPVSEDFALYSSVKNMDYELEEFGTEDAPAVWREKQLYDSQVARQDQWGARMDSVGYGVNASLKELTGKSSWKAKGAAELIKLMTIDKNTQVTLTYAGSQLPNFKSQCEEFLLYQHEDYKETGSFKNMITPDGNAAGEDVWASTYEKARQLVAAKDGTLAEWCTANNVAFDPNYGSDKVSDIGDLAYAMKVLYLVTYNKSDRDLALRMQTGMNAVRDTTMYTYETGWINVFEPRGKAYVMPYVMQAAIKDSQLRNLATDATATPTPAAGQFVTPRWFVNRFIDESQRLLDQAITNEKAAMGE